VSRVPPTAADPPVLCVDIGSTFTKAALVGPISGTLLARGETPTTITTDVMDGVRALAAELGAGPDAPLLACSSAGGGLRLAVVGYERTVTAEAGHRVGLSAGAKVVHVANGPLDAPALKALQDSHPDIVLLVGGTDGGNATVLQHNSARLAGSRLPRTVPIVVAGNTDARDEVAATLAAAGRPQVLADNVLPEIGVVAPESARAAIRAAFLTHVIGGKGLSRDPDFARLVRAATPDAVLRGVEVLAATLEQDVLVVDIGGATTDVYSVVAPDEPSTERPRAVVAQLPHARTVEGDLGMRWNAAGVLYAARLPEDPAHLPVQAVERAAELELARLAALVAVRRHGRPPFPGEPPRNLVDVGLLLGSGGVLRHGGQPATELVLGALGTDHAGGWRVPRAPVVAVDTAYLLVVIGLLADDHPAAARHLARVLTAGPDRRSGPAIHSPQA
jgi:uncharacterized protein (TIGR01319 family)